MHLINQFMPKVALIIPYFGQWPKWMPLYLYSCSKNPMIDFVFFTDCAIPQQTYRNTIFNRVSFDDYCKEVSRILHINFHPQENYKLCDLKVFYGIIHQTFLKNYDWWGFGDIDLVYGDLSIIVNEENLSRYDMLTTHVDRIAGHFTLIRKNSKYTRIPLSLDNWREMLSADKNYSIDEGAYTKLVRPFKYKLINKMYYCFLKRITPSSMRYLCYHYMEYLLRWAKTKVYMREFFTTFHPTKELLCVYNPVKGELFVPAIPHHVIGGGVKYTYISCSIKRLNIGIQINIGVMVFIKYHLIIIFPRVASLKFQLKE